ncbi:hypothetical protein FGK63_03230 [Ruegeria sediminis]|uniref:Iron-binding zinc finger CDGSH type domain-containing protein n=1 Tax=Ruegeria sediminis TaxID=2583820 RepID=A0ABY2X544_9RHOB|nr:CDGSH iron-sulfur domain-containing protein [Ruegeria sediminis]TMV10089.1 hypothetical protein FGK63_03230 [Ruegeria sediminis]
MKARIHAIAGVVGILTILAFWTSTAFSELFASHETIAAVKAMILKGMFVLIPAMAIAGAAGMSLGGKRTDARAQAKKKRMPFIAANGLLVLVPAAFFLEARASAGTFDAWFYAVQVLELIAGATNLTLMGLNIRDGLTMTGRIGAGSAAQKTTAPAIEPRDGGPLVAKAVPVLTGADGRAMETKPVMALCRCGASKTKPYCDGSHNQIGFDSRPSDDHTKDEVLTYEGRDITVHYNRLLCSHAGECGKWLNAVFDSGRKPWIVPNNGAAEKIKAVVKACPSGALRYSVNGEAPQHGACGTPGVTVEKDGPYRVAGIPLAGARLAEGASAEKYVLCRCGASRNKPYCDGTHHDIGWRDTGQ